MVSWGERAVLVGSGHRKRGGFGTASPGLGAGRGVCPGTQVYRVNQVCAPPGHVRGLPKAGSHGRPRHSREGAAPYPAHALVEQMRGMPYEVNMNVNKNNNAIIKSTYRHPPQHPESFCGSCGRLEQSSSLNIKSYFIKSSKSMANQRSGRRQ